MLPIVLILALLALLIAVYSAARPAPPLLWVSVVLLAIAVMLQSGWPR